MGKILLLAIAIWLVYVILKRYRASVQRPRDNVTEDMVQCATCGMHLPKSDSLTQDGLHFCSHSHLEQHHDR